MVLVVVRSDGKGGLLLFLGGRAVKGAAAALSVSTGSAHAIPSDCGKLVVSCGWVGRGGGALQKGAKKPGG